jgi:hypothetical protein
MTMTDDADDAIELLIRKRLPPGGEAVLVRGDDGAMQRGFLYRTAAPFPPIVRTADGSQRGDAHASGSMQRRRLCARDLGAALSGRLGRVLINRDCSAIAGCRKRRVRVAPETQAVFCCRRHQPRRPPAPISHCGA